MSESATFAAPAPETMVQPVHSVEALRATRLDNAEVEVSADMRRQLVRIDRATNARTDITKVEQAIARDVLFPNLVNLMELDAVGLDPHKVLVDAEKSAGPQDEVIAVAHAANEKLTLKRYGNRGYTLGVDIQGAEVDFTNLQKAPQLTQKVQTRFAMSPAYAAVHALSEQYSKSAALPDVITTEPFNAAEDMLGTLALMQDADFLVDTSVLAAINTGVPLAEILKDPTPYFYNSVTVQTTEDGVMYSKQVGGIKKTFRVRQQTGMVTFEVEKDKFSVYNEVADQKVDVDSIPFIDTKCAEDMLGALDRAGLMLHPRFQAELTRIGQADRYGSPYTMLTREIAKWVNRPSRAQVSKMFVRYDPSAHAAGNDERGNDLGIQHHEAKQYEHVTEEQVLQDAAIVKERLRGITTQGMSEPAAVLFSMVQDVLARDVGEPTQPSSLPITQSEISMNSGACFDVTDYYLEAAALYSGSRIQKITENGVTMLEKTHGKHTFMLQEPAVLNGVRLPKGTLMQRGEDAGWAMLRLTPFSFDSEEDRLATGSEMAKALSREQGRFVRLGGTLLKNIVEAVPQAI